MGRPRLPEEERLSQVLCVRLTRGELAEIRADAERRGVTVRAHVRRVMLMVARREVLVR